MSYIYTGRRKPKEGKILPPEFKNKVKLSKKKEWRKLEPKDFKKITYVQNWPMYNRAQVQEKLLFYKILNEAVDSLDMEEKFGYRGRPKTLMRDLVKSAVVKVFTGFSSRRVVSELKMMEKMGYLHKAPSYNTLIDHFASAELEKNLNRLYKIFALPLKSVERKFAIDATGFSTTLKTDWVSERFSFRKKGKWKWKKIHAVCGTKSNVLTSVLISDAHVQDSPQFSKLLSDTARDFKVEEISADKGYLSMENVKSAMDMNVAPYIPSKSNTYLQSRGKGFAWIKMIRLWRDHRQEFDKHYHLRSNIESSFSAMKRKFSGVMRNRKDQSQKNELLAKVVCYNGSILVSSIFELGIQLNWN